VKKTLVTGGCGFIGSALVKRLVSEKVKVRVLDNCSRGSAHRLTEVMDSIEFIQGDICDPNVVDQACMNISRIHHLAYINGTQNFYTKPDLVLEVAVSGINNLLNSCKKNKIEEFFLASTSEVYQVPTKIPTPESERLIVPDVMNPRYTYGGGKILCELMTIHALSKYVDKVIIYRPHNVYGPDMGEEHVLPQFFRRMKKMIDLESKNKKYKFEIQGDGSETRSFIHISDFIDALMLIEKNGSNLNLYHIGNNEEVSISSLAFLVAKEINLNIELVPGPLSKGSTPRRCPDIKSLQSLGYKQNKSLEEGIKTLVEWYT